MAADATLYVPPPSFMQQARPMPRLGALLFLPQPKALAVRRSPASRSQSTGVSPLVYNAPFFIRFRTRNSTGSMPSLRAIISIWDS